jgi:hypothetical protein
MFYIGFAQTSDSPEKRGTSKLGITRYNNYLVSTLRFPK